MPESLKFWKHLSPFTKAAFKRALKTVAQTAAALLLTHDRVSGVDWGTVIDVSAMSGLLGVSVAGTISGYSGQAAPALTDYSGRIGAAQAFSGSVGTIPLPSTDGFIDSLARGNASSGAAGGGTDVQPLNITTEIVLDGDKLGEAVSRYNVKRNRITNGIEA